MAYFTHLVLEMAKYLQVVDHLVHQDVFAVIGLAAYSGKNVCVLPGCVRAERHVVSFN
jgi:hypothetical protein